MKSLLIINKSIIGLFISLRVMDKMARIKLPEIIFQISKQGEELELLRATKFFTPLRPHNIKVCWMLCPYVEEPKGGLDHGV